MYGKAKEKYFKIGAVPCPAFAGELVYFNRHGWNHLLRKGRFIRDKEEQAKRLKLLKYAEYILRRTNKISEFKENTIDDQSAYFWTIERYINNILIRIVIRKLDGGRRHFFSIMGKNNEKIP